MKMENEEVKMLSAEYVRLHSTEDDAWVIHEGSVYDVTKFLSKHPGGKEIVLQHAGQDVTALMANDDFHQHSISAYSLLETYKIGKLKVLISDFNFKDGCDSSTARSYQQNFLKSNVLLFMSA